MSTRATGCGVSPASAELQVSSVSVHCGSSGLRASLEYLNLPAHIRKEEAQLSGNSGIMSPTAMEHMVWLPIRHPKPSHTHNIRCSAKICRLWFSQKVRGDSSKDSLLPLYYLNSFSVFASATQGSKV